MITFTTPPGSLTRIGRNPPAPPPSPPNPAPHRAVTSICRVGNPCSEKLRESPEGTQPTAAEVGSRPHRGYRKACVLSRVFPSFSQTEVARPAQRNGMSDIRGPLQLPQKPLGDLDSCAGNQSLSLFAPDLPASSGNAPDVSGLALLGAFWYTRFLSLVFPSPQKLLHLLNDLDQMSPAPRRVTPVFTFLA